jgi:hypothetical protein
VAAVLEVLGEDLGNSVDLGIGPEVCIEPGKPIGEYGV